MEGVEPPAPRILVWWPWALGLLVAVLGLIVVDGMRFADDVAATDLIPRPASEFIWVDLVAIALSIVVALPALALLVRGSFAIGFDTRTSLVALLAGGVAIQVCRRLGIVVMQLTGIGISGDPADFDVNGIVIAPVIEETAKLVVIALLLRFVVARVGVREGILVGLTVGLGATIGEAGIFTQIVDAGDGGQVFGSVIALRLALFGLGLHAATAGLIGVALGYRWSGRSTLRWPAVLAVAFVAALALHALSNAATGQILAPILMALVPSPDFGALEPIPHPLFWLASSAASLVLLWPAYAALALAWRRFPARATIRVASSLSSG
jgi:RsiW-degrading membrane proteinase PrsW (M82 family)